MEAEILQYLNREIGPKIGPYGPYREGPNAQGLYWGAQPPKPPVGAFRARALMPKRSLE